MQNTNFQTYRHYIALDWSMVFGVVLHLREEIAERSGNTFGNTYSREVPILILLGKQLYQPRIFVRWAQPLVVIRFEVLGLQGQTKVEQSVIASVVIVC